MRGTSKRLSGGSLTLLIGLSAFFILFLIYPSVFLLKGAFFEPVEGGQQFTFKYFGMLLSSPVGRESLWNSLSIALFTLVGTTCLSLPLAAALAKYTFRGKMFLTALLLAPMIMPPFVGAIGLKQLLGRFGTLNLFLMDTGLLAPDAPIDWLGQSGFWGIVILQVLNLYPILLLNLAAAMGNVDPSLREAGYNLGARPWRVFRTITLPLILPGYFAGAVIVFIWAFTDLGTPLVFGFNRVVPAQIFDAVNEINTNPMGYTLVVFVLILTTILFWGSKALFAGKRYEMFGRGHGTSEKSATIKELLLIWAGALTVAMLGLAPHLMVVVHSFADGWFISVLPQGWTGEHYGEVFSRSLAQSSIRNSLYYAGFSTALDLVLGIGIAWLLTRKQLRFAGVLDALAMLPLALPGIVLAFGYVGAFDWNIPWLNPRQNPSLLLIVSYAVRRLPYMVRSAYAGFQQSSVTLEEASANVGAGPLRTFWKITAPLIMANLAAGALLTFSFAMLEVSDSLILAMREQYFPITKMIYQILGRIDPNSASVACALGVVGMIILAVSLWVATKLMGKSLGQLFRA